MAERSEAPGQKYNIYARDFGAKLRFPLFDPLLEIFSVILVN